MHIDLSGKTALVTGGSRGIGRAACVALASAGAKVIINYNKSEEKALALKDQITALGAEADIFKADVSDPDQVQALFNHVQQKHKVLDIIVNNAGIIKDNLLLSMRLSDWDKVLDTNLRSAFLCTQQAAEMMMPRQAGKIINISSIIALRNTRGQANYAASKGGLAAFTRACAVELSPRGIQVNAVMPGMISTDMTVRARKRASEEILERIPAGRFGEPEDIAALIVFLASEQASYITGQSICVDGGMTIG
ncbi:MAG: 3-oxoacyl-[acyl-carrier-protein] reductase [Nitrospira sp.]|nr:3-oxoacyl-[acyl-carrier-protein] reductase [bacterium]MBL7048976.1 3-oxoacyl-[acyl-carrier-protein] reductase [Nitrospira sp.]